MAADRAKAEARHLLTLVGRGADFARLSAAVGGHALVTITGPGGVGKTALADRFVRVAEPDYAAVVRCDLTETRTEEGLLGALASALGLELGTARDREAARAAVRDALHARSPTLLLLDNAEGLVAAGAAGGIQDLLGGPALRVLVTSREPLDVRSEERFDLAPLTAAASRQLLLERAAAARPGFALTADDEALVDRLTARLDRLPLAIELAAARLEVLTVSDLAERVDKSLSVLRRPGVPGRHAGMRAALEASWELLPERERRVLARSSVFAAGFGLEAAEAVLGVGEEDALDALQELRRRSLLRAAAPEESGHMRFSLFETIRAFAAEKLTESREHEQTLLAHAEFFAEHGRKWAESADFMRLSGEVDNLAAACERAVKLAPRAAVEAGLALDALLTLRGPLVVRGRFLQLALEAAEAADDAELRARVHVARGEAARSKGELSIATAEIESALALLPKEGGHPLLGTALSALGTARAYTKDTAGSEEAFRAALEHLPAARPRERGQVLMRLSALALMEGSFGGDAERLGEEALELLEAAGDRRAQGIVLANLGLLYLETGRNEEALERFEAGLALYEEVGDRASAAQAYVNMGLLRLEAGELHLAWERFERALAEGEGVGDGITISCAHGGIGLLHAFREELDEARAELAEARRVASERRAAGFEQLFLAWQRRLGGGGPEPRLDRFASRALKGAVRLLEGCPEPGDETAGIHARLAALWGEPQQAKRAALELCDGGFAFTYAGGEKVDLARRGSLRRVLLRLAEAHEKEGGRPLSVHEILDAGWPGEQVQPEAGANRVYTAIRHLRRLGLEAVLVTRDGGYLLDPDTEVRGGAKA